MPKSKTHPKDALTVRTYAELRRYVEAFARGHLNLLIVLGAPGLGKSRVLRDALGDEACWIEANATPFGMYCKLYEERDRLVVIDDVDSLYADRTGVRLLKCLCQTEPVKSVAWYTAAAGLDRESVPRQFHTKSRVVIVANDWKTLNENVAAVQDRGHTLEFAPSAEEVHAEAGNWFRDPEVYNWFSGHLHLLDRPSLRHYVRAAELKSAGLPWISAVLAQTLPEKTRLVAELKADPAYTSEEARVEAFVEQTGGCRATYFNHARKLRRDGQDRRAKPGQPPPLRVVRSPSQTQEYRPAGSG